MPSDPFSNFRFKLEIDKLSVSEFMEVSGIASSVDVIEYSDGSGPSTVRKIPGRSKYENITLKWGMTSSLELYDWHAKILQGERDRRSLSIILLDATGVEIARWNVIEAWPCNYEGPTLNAKTNEVAIESIELAHGGLRRVK